MTRKIKRSLGLILGAAMVLGTQARAEGVSCGKITHDGISAAVCQISADADLRLWLNDPNGQPFGSFSAIRAALPKGQQLVFAMNAGMYHEDRRPVGLFVQDGVERAPLVTAAGPGNFGMRPNGVFCVGDRFAIIESRAFDRQRPACRLATQSGPMLVIEGALHPRFLSDSTSRHIRNGVGVSGDGRSAWFAISDKPVTFHEFARLFRDGLGTPNALFLDGSISRLYAPELNRNDWGMRMGPVIGVVAPDQPSP